MQDYLPRVIQALFADGNFAPENLTRDLLLAVQWHAPNPKPALLECLASASDPDTVSQFDSDRDPDSIVYTLTSGPETLKWATAVAKDHYLKRGSLLDEEELRNAIYNFEQRVGRATHHVRKAERTKKDLAALREALGELMGMVYEGDAKDTEDDAALVADIITRQVLLSTITPPPKHEKLVEGALLEFAQLTREDGDPLCLEGKGETDEQGALDVCHGEKMAALTKAVVKDTLESAMEMATEKVAQRLGKALMESAKRKRKRESESL